MRGKRLIGVGGLAVVFFCLPSLAVKIWEALVYTPWQVKRWFGYPLLALLCFWWARRHWRPVGRDPVKEEHSLLYLAKQRLVKGEISLEEFRAIRQELKID